MTHPKPQAAISPRPQTDAYARALSGSAPDKASEALQQRLNTRVKHEVRHPVPTHLDLDRPAEVGDIDVEGDVVVVSEVELLTGEAVAVLLDVAPGHDGHLLAGNGPGLTRKGSMGGQVRQCNRSK